MPTYNLPPTYFTTFTYVDSSGYVKPAVGYKLYQYASGTTTPQDTYTTQGGTANSHPITLDANGACNLWLDPTLEYTFVLKTPGGTTVWTRDDVFASPNAASVVSSVNGETGAVTLTAPDIGYTTNSPQSWFSGATVGAALDDIITQVNAEPAANVTVADSGGYYAGANAETVLQEIGPKLTPSQTGKSGQYLTTDGTTSSWAGPWSHMLSAADGSATSRSVLLNAGTWEITLLTTLMLGEPDAVDVVVTQASSVDTITGTATATLTINSTVAAGLTGAGPLLGSSAVGKATITIVTTGSYTFRIAAPSATNTSSSTITYTGSIAYLQRTA